MIYQLYYEILELVYRGLNKQYKKSENDLKTPRGRIDINKLATRRAVVGATLPCLYFERNEDNELNQVLLAGLHLASELTDDRNLRIRLHMLCKKMGESISTIELNRVILTKVLKSINRLTNIIEVHLNEHIFGITRITERNGYRINGFFLDMNRFFIPYIYYTGLFEGYTVRDESFAHLCAFS